MGLLSSALVVVSNALKPAYEATMTLLITGGAGFVMSNLARSWLDSDPTARAIVIDLGQLDATAQRFFEPILMNE